MTGPLVDTPEANKFRANAKLSTWHNIWFGDPAKLPKEVHGFMKRASDALHTGLDKVAALADDPTKTPVVRHETAKAVANKTIAEIVDAKGRMEAAGRSMMADANAAIDQAFALNDSRTPVYERIVNWINSKATEPAKIREAMKQDPQIVTVLSQYPPYVFDLAEDVARKIVIDGYIHHMPETADKLLQGQALVETAAGYDRAVKGVQGSFYNETMAAQAAKRVEA